MKNHQNLPVWGCMFMKQHNRFINDYFISSTFRDMQQERDILNNRILPELRELANKSGRDISLVDLRRPFRHICPSGKTAACQALLNCSSTLSGGWRPSPGTGKAGRLRPIWRRASAGNYGDHYSKMGPMAWVSSI